MLYCFWSPPKLFLLFFMAGLFGLLFSSNLRLFTTTAETLLPAGSPLLLRCLLLSTLPSPHTNTHARLSELGTSPGLIEASFMGMAARSSQHQHPNASSSSSVGSRSATLAQMMQQQQAAIRSQQEEQARTLQHSRSTASFGEWNGSQVGGSGSESLAGSRPASSGGQRYPSPSPAGPQQQQQQALDWELAQQQLRLPLLIPLPQHQLQGRGLRALPGRPGLHWLSQADDRESAARGLLGLPRPGLRTNSTSSAARHQRQQQQSPARAAAAEQQQGWDEGGGEREGEGVGCAAADAPSSPSDGDVCLHIPAGALTQETPPRVRYNPAVLAAFAAAIDGTNGVPRGAAGSSSGSPCAARTPRSLFSSRSFGRQASTGSKEGLQSGGRSMSRSGSYVGMPTCLICLDQLTAGDFETGEAMYLACRCKGEVALRHRQCAEKWSRIKGNTICDVCKAPILNLPDVPPLPAPPPPPGMDDRLLYQGAGLWGPFGDEPPAVADYVFDCIRVTWVVLIVCILFFELSVSRAFVTGALVGCSYVALSVSLASCRRLRQQRREEGGGGGGAWQEGLHVPLLGGGRGHFLPV